MRAGAGGAGAHLDRHQTGGAGELVGPHEVYFRGTVDEAANQAIGPGARPGGALRRAARRRPLRRARLARLGGGRRGRRHRLPLLHRRPGARRGRDRQAAGGDRAAPHRAPRHQPETDPDDDLRQRVRAIHLVHDGMRNPQEIRRPMPLPLPVEPTRPTISGHGGEIAHGFYYPSPKKLSEVRKGGEEGLVDRLEEAARQKHARRPPRRLPRLPRGGRARPRRRAPPRPGRRRPARLLLPRPPPRLPLRPRRPQRPLLGLRHPRLRPRRLRPHPRAAPGREGSTPS